MNGIDSTDPGRASKAVALVAGAAPSPFDAIRRVRADGSEYWTARDLCHVTECETWRNFAAAVGRAKVAIENAGGVVTSHVVDADNLVPRPQGGSISREDWELSRYGAYMVLMNGDPRKPKIAEAQSYFAHTSRENELAMDMSDPLVQLEMQVARTQQAIAIAKSERARADKAEKVVEVEQRHRRAIEGGDGIKLTDFSKKYFSEVRHTDFFEHLYAKTWLIDQRGTRVNSEGEVRDGYDHGRPTRKGRAFIYAHDTGNYGGRRRFQPRVRPQMEIALRDALAAEGLPVNKHSTGLVAVSAGELQQLEFEP